jgi:F-type H+-transporting ATPase subunit epsilon
MSSKPETHSRWRIEIVTPEGERLQPEATLVELVTAEGQIGVMPGHERLLTVLDIGELIVHNGRRREVYMVGGGFARVMPGSLSVLAYSLERTGEDQALEKCKARQRELEGDDGQDHSCDA